MSNGALILHRGARQVERAEVELVKTPPPTSTHFPQPHSQVLSTVERTLGDAGFSISRMQLALSPCNARFFGTIDLASSIAEGVTLTVGVRNSHDKTFPLGLVAGNRVFVCDNLAFSSSIYVAKKHTRFSENRFVEGIAHAVRTLGQYQEIESKRIAVYREHPLSENEAASVLLHGYEEGVLNTRTLPEAIAEWRKPSHPEFEPRTAFSLFNAFTSALKTRQGNPAEFASLTMKLYGLIDREANYTIAV